MIVNESRLDQLLEVTKNNDISYCPKIKNVDIDCPMIDCADCWKNFLTEIEP